MLQSLLDIVFPPSSLRGVSGVWLTALEERQLKAGWPERISKQTLSQMGCTYLDTVVAGDRYARSPDLRSAVHRFKYRGSKRYLRPAGSVLLRAAALLDVHRGDVLCPVPLHWTRLFLRGFNQSDILARAIAEELQVPVCPFLKRVRATGSQAKRTDRAARWSAMSDAFALRVPVKEIPERRVILVDDVFTSGATLEACARALKQAGVQRVDALVVARG